MSRSERRLRHQGERASRARETRRRRMRFMLNQSYAPIEGVDPMSSWAPEDVRTHIDAQLRLNRELSERGELVDAQGLTAPELARVVVSDGSGAPAVRPGGAGELLAGYRVVDVESPERAIEIAARASAAPGPEGVPIEQPIEVREIMSEQTTRSEI
jgi:hypothetical protein